MHHNRFMLRMAALSLVLGVAISIGFAVHGVMELNGRVQHPQRLPTLYQWVPPSSPADIHPLLPLAGVMEYGLWRVDATEATWSILSMRTARAMMIESHFPDWPEPAPPGLSYYPRLPTWMNGRIIMSFHPPEWHSRDSSDHVITPRPLPSWATDASYLRDGHVFVPDGADERTGMHIWIFAFGWPLPWLRSIHLRDRQDLFSPLPTIDDAGKELNWTVLEGWWQEDSLPIPGRVLYGNLLLNIVILGLPLWCAAMMMFIIRRKMRGRRGHCPRCGYDMRGLNTPGCPECGWNRASDASAE